MGCGLVRVSQSFNSAELLAKWRGGDQEALQDLIPLVYKELRAAAHRCLRAERPGHTLQSTALVHEVYLRLAGGNPAETQDRAHFVAVAARLMRQVLVDYSRRHRAAKRGPEHKVVLTEIPDLPQQRGMEVIALDDALTALSQRDAQQVQIVELRFFGGLTLEETAAVLGISTATVKRDWNVAKAWLARELQRGNSGKNKAVGEG
jgi:RNA polymerase sigma factor (TIGR02999 family)